MSNAFDRSIEETAQAIRERIDPPAMTGAEFRAICQMLWGSAHGWGHRGCAETMGINERNVLRMAAGEREIGQALASAMLAELRLRIADHSDMTPALVVIRKVNGAWNPL